MYDIMHYLEKNQLPGLLMLVDFQKAFDSVSWLFLNNVLKFYNYGRDFCHWINVLNKNIQVSIWLLIRIKQNSTNMYDTEFDLLGLHFSVDLETITTLNYLPILNKCQKIINQWKIQKLFPLGKITFIKYSYYQVLTIFLLLFQPQVHF